MKFVVNTKELKNILSVVKTVAELSATARVSPHCICLLRALPEERKLKLDFTLNGSFLSYEFEDLQLQEHGDTSSTPKEEVRRSLDLGDLTSLKFSGKHVTIEVSESERGNTITFSSNALKGSVLVSRSDIEAEIDASRPKESWVSLDHQFFIPDFTKALAGQDFGGHRSQSGTESDITKRTVRIFYGMEGYEDGKIHFVSKDDCAACHVEVTPSLPIKEPFNYFLLPKPLLTVLSTLSLEESPNFHFGLGKDRWRLSHGRINLWFSNIVQEAKVDSFLKTLNEIPNRPSYKLQIAADVFQFALAELNPFMSNSNLVSKKEDQLVVTMKVTNPDKKVVFGVETSRAKGVEREMSEGKLIEDQIELSGEEKVTMDFKYLYDFISHLIDLSPKNNEGNLIEPVTLQWWPWMDKRMPTKGRTICMNSGSNYYLVSRISPSSSFREV